MVNSVATTGQLLLTRSVDREDIASYQVILLVTNTELGMGELCGGSNISKLNEWLFHLAVKNRISEQIYIYGY